MKILVCHNFYQQPGGEDRVYEDECRLLETHGHTVVRFTKHNDQIKQMGRVQALQAAIWNRSTQKELTELIRHERPDVMHCHNTFPLISPSAYYAARSEGVAVVQTLHNYRLLCPGANLLRDGNVCEKCVGMRVPLPAIKHSCYRNNRGATATVSAMLAFHHQKQTWQTAIDRYIALTRFSRDKFIEGGLPAERIRIKPNLVEPDPGPGAHDGDFAIFVGRLSAEKGTDTLLEAWRNHDADIPLKIIGDGPLADHVRESADRDSRIEHLGYKPSPEVAQQIGRARVLIMPSVCYETFGRTIVEAFAAGTPVLASSMGAMQELIEEGHNGHLFNPGDGRSLASTLQSFWADAESQSRLQANARSTYESAYTAGPNYSRLVEIYEEAIAASRSRHDVEMTTA